METTQNIIVPILSVAIWPVVILILVGYVFRRALIDLIERIRKVGRDGVEVGARAPTTQNTTPPASSSENTLTTYHDPNPTIDKWQKRLQQHIEETKPALQKANISIEIALCRALAVARLETFLERIYSTIWGSQLILLYELNRRKSEGMSSIEATAIFDKAVSDYKDFHNNNSFERWRAFLTTNSLVKSQDDRLFIDHEGEELLLYIVRRGYSVQKFG